MLSRLERGQRQNDSLEVRLKQHSALTVSASLLIPYRPLKYLIEDKYILLNILACSMAVYFYE